MATTVKQPLGIGKKNQAKPPSEPIDSGPNATTEQSPMRTTVETNATSTRGSVSPVLKSETMAMESKISNGKLRKLKQNNEKIRQGCDAAGSGDYKRAIAIFSEVIPATYESFYYRGCAHLETGEQAQIFEAINDFNEAINLEEEEAYPKIYYKRAFACHLIGQHAGAIIDYTTFIQYNEWTPAGYLGRGLAYIELKNYEKAVKDIEKANELNPNPTLYYKYCLARAQASSTDRKEQFDQLANTCANGDAVLEQNFENHFYRGVILYESDKYADALEAFDRALACAPSKQQIAETTFYIGLAKYALKDVATARVKLEAVISQNPNHTRALFRLGMIESRDSKCLPDAVKYLTKAHSLTPHKSDILYERADLQYRLGHLDACMNDKQRALQLEQSSASSTSTKSCYELLSQRLSSLFSRKPMSKSNNLIMAMIHDKMYELSHGDGNLSESETQYSQAVGGYQSVIDPEKENDYSILSYALMFNLCNDHKHAVAAMTSIDQFNRILDDKKELGESLRKLIEKVKEKKNQQSHSSLQNYQEMLEIVSQQKDPQVSRNVIDNEGLIYLLIDKLTALEKIVNSRNKIDLDLEHFKGDPKGNQTSFYKKIRITLSHTFAAMAVTSGVGEDPILRHDKTGTQSLIGEAVSALGGFIGGMMTMGGGAISAIAGFAGDKIKEKEHQDFQERMSFIANVGNIEELNEIARRIARRLTDNYNEQLVSLNERPEPSSTCSCDRLPCFSKQTVTVTVTEPAPKDNNQGTKTAKEVAQFGINFMWQAILVENLNDLKLKDGMTADELVESLVQLISRATPNLAAKARRKLKLDKNAVLPHDPLPHIKQGTESTAWHLHDFYRKPTIRAETSVQGVNETLHLPWMDSKMYGFRRGTRDEYEHLSRFVEITDKSSCCC